MRRVRLVLSLVVIASSAVGMVVEAAQAAPLPPGRGPDWTAQSDQVNGWLGYSVASAGDVNGDGFADVIVGAYRYDAGQVDAGKAWAFHGSSAGLSATAGWTKSGGTPGAFFGHSVHTAGDVNGDGYDDVIVGAPNPTRGTKRGLVYVFHGSPTGLNSNPDWTVEGDQAVAWFGRTVRAAGDVNGDGFDDVIVGAPHHDNGQVDEGKAWVYHGSSAGLHTTADWTAESDQAAAWFGRWVALAGDVNADGFDDVIVDAHLYNNGQVDEGKAWVYHGSSAGLHTTADWTAEGDQPEAWFARAVGPAGDVDGDGYDDVIVGAPMYDNGELNEGLAFVYHGSATGLGPAPDWTAEADQSGAMFGRAVWTTGDVNGDGFADVIVGAPNFDTLQTDAGKAHVYHGSSDGLSTSADWTAQVNQKRAWFGRSVATARDVNGDGFDDVVVGSPQYDAGQKDEGMAFVFQGSEQGLRGQWIR